MKRLNTLAINVPIWNWSVVLFDGDDTDRLIGILSELGIETTVNANANGHTWVCENKPIIVWVEDRDDIATLAHEAMHAVFGMLESRGLKHTSESEEAYTYTVSFILDAALKQRWQRVTSNMRLRT